MVSKGHYVCNICHEYIRQKRQGKITGQKVENYLIKIWKDYVTGSYKTYHTKAHEKCLKKLRGN